MGFSFSGASTPLTLAYPVVAILGRLIDLYRRVSAVAVVLFGRDVSRLY